MSEYDGYRNIIVPFLQQIESNAYFNLRNFSEKDANQSSDYYMGKQNGRLEVIEDFRLMVATALAELKMDEARKKAKEEADKNRPV